MVIALSRRPSLSVAACVVVVVVAFVWRGDLRLDGAGRQPAQSEEPVAAVEVAPSAPLPSPEPVIVRRAESAARAKVRVARRAGRVVDSLGFLLVGAEVARPEAPSLRTDGDGAFVAELTAGKLEDLLVRADGRRAVVLHTTAQAPDPLWVCLEPIAPWDAPTTLAAKAPELHAEGLVRDASGAPLAGAFVNVAGTDSWAQSDDIGRVSVPLVGVAARFVVHRDGVGGAGGLASLSGAFTAPRAQGVVPMPDLVAETGGSLRGVVRDVRGEPVAGLAVEVRSRHVRRIAETGVGGAFVVGGLMPDEYEVQPFAHRGAVGAPQRLRIDRAVVACDLHLQRLEERPLQVLDERGDALAGVWVVSSLHGLRRGVAQTDAAGQVRLPAATASQFEVRAAGDEAFVVREVRRVDVEADPATLVVAMP
ncbi:MAG: hypothetical protein H6835_17835 [Planctomycetes bacterium]|nr:hypothetical protein [Planctomycetota bacterium]